MMNLKDFQLFVAALAIACSVAFYAVASRAGDVECGCEREFSWERGPIRREIARVADSQKEEEEDFERRIHRYSWAISDATDAHFDGSGFTKKQLSALQLTIGKHESHWDKRVCEDFTENAPGAPAFGCWQSENKEGPPETVEDAALRAAKDLVSARHYCVSRGYPAVSGAISLYATGRTCEWSGADERVKTFNAIHWRMTR